MRRVLVPPPGDLGYGGHGALQGTTRLGDHSVVAQVEVQCLDDVGGVVVGSWLRRSGQGRLASLAKNITHSLPPSLPDPTTSPSSQIFCASVQKAMLGSSRWNRAQDLDRKLGPWKQARVMWLPWRLMEPPSCTASSGRGIWKREMWQPAITFSTPGQWRWWAASISAEMREESSQSNCSILLIRTAALWQTEHNLCLKT